MPLPAPRPFRPVKPGELLREELDERGWTQADFARILGRPLQVVNEIDVGKKAITAETAVALSKALGTSAEYWLRLDALYRLDLLHGRCTSSRTSSPVTRKGNRASTTPWSAATAKSQLPKRDPKSRRPTRSRANGSCPSTSFENS